MSKRIKFWSCCGVLIFSVNSLVNESIRINSIDASSDQFGYCNTAMIEGDAERRGCCSHHNGVCGCSTNGKAMCCDGAESPSCGC